MEQDIRVVGKPQGADLLYVEDYVYSFINLVLSKKESKCIEVFLLGKEKAEKQKHYYYVSGVVLEERDAEQFGDEEILWKANVTLSKDEYPEIHIKNQKDNYVDFGDYYIYYAENENMKNYLLSFSESKNNNSILKEKKIEVNKTKKTKLSNIGEILKYTMAVFGMAYIIFSMNHYCKLIYVGQQVEHVINIMSQEDTFYTP